MRDVFEKIQEKKMLSRFKKRESLQKLLCCGFCPSKGEQKEVSPHKGPLERGGALGRIIVSEKKKFFTSTN
jgi:hypothetical protein